MSTSFSHIFQGGYSSGYYSYKWAEVLDADAFAYFQEKGIFNKEVATKFKDNVLSKGGTELPMELYKTFQRSRTESGCFVERAGLIYNINEVIPSTINYIHGELNSEENPIIFGFGDEHDKHYLGFEDEKNDELFKHIKSFNYYKTSNYHNLIRFINSDDFQVYIIGHSCGLSDRTMLKEIFEHENCKSIKIFYFEKSENENDYTNKTYDISRHFTDKGLMRKKIVPFDKSKPLR
jgi:uncharacterized pyridoxamine 5'-phosphate oxidase family protein